MPEIVGARSRNPQSQSKQRQEKQKLPPCIIIESHGLNSKWNMWKNLNDALKIKAPEGTVVFGGYFLLTQKDLVFPKKDDQNKSKMHEKKDEKQDESEEYLGFHNADLFSPIEWQKLKKRIKEDPGLKKSNISRSGTSPHKQIVKQILQSAIQNKIVARLQNNQSVIFSFSYTNNQDDFRRQGEELKEVIDFVKPAGRKVTVIGHSMGCLATASYINHISREFPVYLTVAILTGL